MNITNLIIGGAALYFGMQYFKKQRATTPQAVNTGAGTPTLSDDMLANPVSGTAGSALSFSYNDGTATLADIGKPVNNMMLGI